jgi:membrane protease YdiL (CAAX protease family)
MPKPVSSGAEQSVWSLTTTDAVIILVGVALFGSWLLGTSLGRKALSDSRPRRNRMAPYTPIALFFVLFLGTALLQSLVRLIVGDLEGWRGLFVMNVVSSVASAATVAIILIVAAFQFARGLKGFGLRLKTIPRDVVFAFGTLLAVWPLVGAIMRVTEAATKALFGRDFQVPQHEALELISQSPAPALEIVLIVLAVVLAPLVEEMLFRGLFQSMIRSHLGRPWISIVLTSILFACIHANPTHWPALFTLAMGLGYAYEKSGSLVRPILMHAMFNAFIIGTLLLQQHGPA